ncbi:dethiobiotin synthase [Chitinivibrio alkaliphilus]|uniref:ATP-dependent dethiobiotin synthetase BioD n=1 Tax=Chitinivibrio alkaliphilus ACht1 TaxID=1313304 RepID=U7DEL7_9BACT|nr:dethiobiotin synthase [Chitinivibrio alkaliphilus]ERP39381.1 dithiobiotin synthetase [Chitinivibrio alkaliphilus ACht1]
MGHAFAIVAPNTDTGKTQVVAALFHHLQRQKRSSAVMKPVQTGASKNINGEWLAEDLAACYARANQPTPPIPGDHVPYVFAPPCSPHLAAQKAQTPIDISYIAECFQRLRSKYDMVLLETAGGILSPLSETETMADMIGALGIPAVLLLPNTLGAISQTLSAVESLSHRAIPIAGIIVKEGDQQQDALNVEISKDNMRYIHSTTKLPLLGHMGYTPRPEELPHTYASECKTIIERLYAYDD